MIARTCKPDGPLSAFVDYLWYMESPSPLGGNELSLPDGSVDLIIDLSSAQKVPMANASHERLLLDPVFVCGPHSRPFVICNTPETRVIGVHFKIGGAYPLLGWPLNQLLNVMLPMDSIWGSMAGELREELLDLTNVDDMFRMLSRRLMNLAANRLPIHPAVQYAIEQLDIGEQTGHIQLLVDRIGMSHRRFIELFKRETGYTPKSYSRIRRFQSVLKTMGSSPNDIDWSDLALGSGYYDQSHFIKDFRAFSGLSPSAYEPIPGRHYNHARP
jgi:AraC-like DNA-binding protein